MIDDEVAGQSGGVQSGVDRAQPGGIDVHAQHRVGARADAARDLRGARDAGREVAFTLSDPFVISRHGDDFRALIDAGAPFTMTVNCAT